MKTQIKDLPKSQKEITVEISTDEMERYMDKSADKLSRENEFDGFRKGKAPRNVVEQQLGKQKIFIEANNIAIEDSYFKALKENKLDPIGQPKAEITKAAPGNPFEYKITISVMPEVKLGNYKKVSGKMKVKEIKNDEVEKEIKVLQKKRASYITKNEPAQKGDRVEIDFESRMGGVKVERGESKNHPLIIGEDKFVPGFEDQLVGMKKDDKKEFDLVFPQDYYKKELAGKNVSFKVEVRLVQKVNPPEINDKFARELGKFENLDSLRKSIKEGLAMEEKEKVKKEFRSKLVDQICKETSVEIPEILINSELDNMINEFKNNITYSGIKFEDYIQSINTTEEKLRNEWKDMAEKRVKTGLVMREISIKENIKVGSEEIEEKINHTLKHYPNEDEARKNIDMEKFKNYVAAEIVNEKVFSLLEKFAERNEK